MKKPNSPLLRKIPFIITVAFLAGMTYYFSSISVFTHNITIGKMIYGTYLAVGSPTDSNIYYLFLREESVELRDWSGQTYFEEEYIFLGNGVYKISNEQGYFIQTKDGINLVTLENDQIETIWNFEIFARNDRNTTFWR